MEQIENTELERNSYFEAEVQLVIFKINDIDYAINIKNIIQIIRLLPISPLPNAPFFVKGVINLRGKVIPVVDLRERFHSKNRQNTKKTRIMIASLQNKEIGLIVDSVKDVIGISKNQIEPPLPVINNLKLEFIEGIAKIKKQIIIIVNIFNLLSSTEKSVLKGPNNE